MSDYKKRGYLLENFRLFHLRSRQGTQTEFHYHEFCKVLLLLSGSGAYFIDGQRYLLQSGDIVLIGSRSIHKPELDTAAPYERIILYISPEYLQRESTAGCNLLSVFSGEDFGREILSNADLLRLLVEIGRSRNQTGSFRPSPVMPKNERILEILRYIDNHLSEELDAETLAQTFFISKYHMMRLFRQETGTTVHMYITQKRLIRARELMDGGMRATEACYQCGFHSYSSFTRACSRLLGTTPTGKADRSFARGEDYE